MVYSVSVNFAWSLTVWFSRCWTEGYCFEMRKECVWTNVSKFLWWYFRINSETVTNENAYINVWKTTSLILKSCRNNYQKWSKIVEFSKVEFLYADLILFLKQYWQKVFELQCVLGNFHAFLSSADLFQNQCFLKILSGIPSKCQTVKIQFRMDILSGLI